MREFKFFRELKIDNPRFYDVRMFEFVGVSEILHDDNSTPYKHMLFRHLSTGSTISGNVIYEDHPMFNYNN